MGSFTVDFVGHLSHAFEGGEKHKPHSEKPGSHRRALSLEEPPTLLSEEVKIRLNAKMKSHSISERIHKDNNAWGRQNSNRVIKDKLKEDKHYDN